MKKKLLCLLMSAVLALSLFGCGGSDSGDAKSAETSAKEEDAAASEEAEPAQTTTAKTETLSVWLPPFGTEDTMDKEFWETQFDAFEEEHGVTVDVQVIPWENYSEKYMSGIASGSGPDVGYMYAYIFPDFIEMGAIRDIGDLITDQDREIYPYLDEGNIMGAQYALPFILGNPRVIYYNKTILEEAGVEIPTEPITWDSFIEIAQKVTKDTDGDGNTDQWAATMGWGHGDYGILQTCFIPFLLQAGGSMYDEDNTTATFGSEAGVRAAQFIYDLIYEYQVMPTTVTSLTGDDCVAMFNEGKTAFLFEATSTAASIDESIDWGFIPCLQDENALTMAVADQLVLMSDCSDVELGYELIKYMLSADVQAAFHKELSAFPPVNLEEEYNDNPIFETFYTEQSDLIRTEKPVKGAYKISDYLYKNLQLVMMDEMSVEEALTQAQEYANTALQE